MRYGLVLAAAGTVLAVGYTYGPNIYQYIMGNKQRTQANPVSLQNPSTPAIPQSNVNPQITKITLEEEPTQPKPPKKSGPPIKSASGNTSANPAVSQTPRQTPRISISQSPRQSLTKPGAKPKLQESPRTKWYQNLQENRAPKALEGELAYQTPCVKGGPCNRDRDDRDIQLAGVVYTIQTNAFRGQLRTGNYWDRTPVVYLE